MSYVHDLDPFALKIDWKPIASIFGNDFGIRWYGLAYLAGFVCAYWMVHWLAKNRWIEMKPELVGDFITSGAIGVMVGGRVGYALFYSTDLLTKFSSSFPFWGVLEVQNGGMSSHGGILGVLVAFVWFSRKHKIQYLQLFDLAALMGGVGIFFGRMANFVNGELFGRACLETYTWAVKFPTEIFYWSGYHVEKLKTLGPVMSILKDQKGMPQDLSPESWVSWVDRFQYAGPSRSKVLYVLDQIPLLVQEGNIQLKEALSYVLTARYPSQIYQGLMEGLAVFIICFLLWKTPKKPGFLTAVFGVVYSIMRIVGEQYRMPDAHLGYQLFGLTRGQWLSFGLLGLGLIFLFISYKLTLEKCGGWGVIDKCDKVTNKNK